MAGFPQILIGWLVGDIFDLDGTLFTWPDGEIVISAPDFGTSNILCAEFGLSQAGTASTVSKLSPLSVTDLELTLVRTILAPT